MGIIQDGIFVLHKYWDAILVFFISVLGMGWFSLRRIISFQLDYKLRLGASLGVGTVILCLLSLLLALMSRFFSFIFPIGSYAVFFFAVFVLLRDLFHSKLEFPKIIRLIPVAILLFLLLLARLAFLKQILLPPYSDSPIHYQIIVSILQPDTQVTSQLSLDTIFSNYYHFGYHSLVAWLSTIVDTDPLQVMPLVGQLFLVIVPVSSVVMTKVVIGDNCGAFLAGLLSTMGWYMPAFAANWGKYPAIGALAVLPAVTALFVLWRRNPDTSSNNLPWVLAVVAGHVALHSRAVVCLLLFAMSWLVADKLLKDYQFSLFQSIRYTLLYFAALWIFRSYLVDFYGNWPVALSLGVLLPFCFYQFPKFSIGLFLFTVGAGLTVVLPPLLGNGFRELLDRQFLQMLLFIPFSIVVGAGLNGLITSFPLLKNYRVLVVVLLVSLVFWGSPWKRAIYPDNCCNYFQADDQLAFKWMRQHVGSSDLILISSFDNQGQILSTDAGGWIHPLLGLNTNKMQFDTNLISLAESKQICRGEKNVYIYDGGKMFSFNNIDLPLDYGMEEVFGSGLTRIVRISKCER